MSKVTTGATAFLIAITVLSGVALGGDLTFELDVEYDLPSDLQPVSDAFTARLNDIDLDGSLDLIVEDSSFIGAHNLAENRTIVAFPKLTDSLPRAARLGHLDSDTIVDYLIVCVDPQAGNDELHAVRFLSTDNYLGPDTLVLQEVTDQDWNIDSLFLSDTDNDGSAELYGRLSYGGGEDTETLNFGYELDGPTEMPGPLPVDTGALGQAYQLYGEDTPRYAATAREGAACEAAPGEFCGDTGRALFRIYDALTIETEQVLQSALNCGGPSDSLFRGRYAELRHHAVGDILSSSAGSEALLNVEYQTWVYDSDSSLICGTTANRLEIWNLSAPGSMNLVDQWTYPYPDARDAMYVDPRFDNRILLAANLDEPEQAFFYLYDLNWRMSVDTVQATGLQGEVLGYRRLVDSENPSLIAVDGLGTVRLYSILAPTAVEEPDENPALPDAFTLGSPYPNPFNSSVGIPLVVQRKERLRVEVVNLLGRRVATLHDGTAEPGELLIQWDAGKAASGVYFLRVTSDNHSATAKMILMK
jgi:hypothetical protein